MKKINWIFVNIITFVLIACLIFLPLFTLYSPMGNENHIAFEAKTVFGFNFLGGLKIFNQNGELGNEYSIVLHSKLLGFIPVMMLLSMVIIDKATKVSLGKYLVNFLATAVALIYMILLPVFASSFIDNRYYEALDFKIKWGFWICIVFIAITFVYYTYALIKSIKEISKEKQNEEVLANSEVKVEE